MTAVLGDWHGAVGWGSISVAALVALGSAILFRTIRSTGSREARRTGDITITPLMTLPGFTSALLLVALGSGLLGWPGDVSRPLVNGTFGLWWVSNAIVIARAIRFPRRRHGRRPFLRVGVIAVVVAAAAGAWFVWRSLVDLI